MQNLKSDVDAIYLGENWRDVNQQGFGLYFNPLS
jgi:hypothetical protein